MRLVTSIEYQASDRREGGREGKEEGSSNSSLLSLVQRECAGRGETWCAVTPSYPTTRVEERVAACGQVLNSYRAVLSQDLALLGDNSASVISSEKDKERPWSWKVTVPTCLGSSGVCRFTPTRSGRSAPATCISWSRVWRGTPRVSL